MGMNNDLRLKVTPNFVLCCTARYIRPMSPISQCERTMTFFVFPYCSSSFCSNCACARPVTQHGIVTRCTRTQPVWLLISHMHGAHTHCWHNLFPVLFWNLFSLLPASLSFTSCDRFWISVTCVSFSAPPLFFSPVLPCPSVEIALASLCLVGLLFVVSVQVCCTMFLP